MTARLTDTIASAESALMPDTAAAVDFLRRWAPVGPWVLTSIVPDGKTKTDTFQASETERLTRWINERQGIQNIYFQVNPARRHLTSKASKADVAALAWLHVDIDPDEGEAPQATKARALAVLRGHSNPPTVIVDSGGGVQAFWQLAVPLPLLGDNDDERVAHAEAQLEPYNVALARAFGGDHCHNIDRIMRLPGTVNIPNRKKMKEGRVRALARLIEFEPSRIYSIEDFERAEPVRAQAAGASIGNAKHRGPARSTGDMPPAATGPCGPEELQAWAQASGKTIPDWPLAVLVHGRDFDTAKYPTRSEALWAVLCGLARAGVPAALMQAAILDKNNSASACVLDKDRPEQEAAEQVAKALAQVTREQQEAVEPELAELNSRHAVLTQIDGKARVLCWDVSELDDRRSIPLLQSFEDFRNRYLNRTVQVGTDAKGNAKYAKLGAWWLEHPQRREYLSLRLMPGRPAECDGYLNLWQGFGVQEKPGEWPLMRAHILNVIAAGNEDHADYILRWMAWAVQHPDEPAEVALVLCGGKGTGKGFFGRALCRLFGQHSLQIGHPSHLTGKFNAHLRSCLLLFCDEASSPDDKAGESVLKTLVTEEAVTVERKGVDAAAAKNRLKIVMASNYDWVVPTSLDERRFAVFKLTEDRAQDHSYFAALSAEMTGDGLAAMLYDLRHRDLADWHPRKGIPETDALLAQKAESLQGVDAVLLDLLREGAVPGLQSVGASQAAWVSTSAVLDYASQRLRSARGPQKVTLNDVGLALQSLGAKVHRCGVQRVRGYLLPSLAEAREAWCSTRMPVKWNDADSWAPLAGWPALQPEGPSPF